MGRASGQKDYISMAKGLVTEASALAFPEGATANELNFTIDRDGLVRKRRLGLQNLVADFSVTGVNASVENVFYWRGPSYVCVIVHDDTPRTLLRFHAVDADFTFVSEVQISAQRVQTQIAQTTNLLVVTTSNGEKPIVCEYDSVANSIVVNDVTLYVRDFELVDDSLDLSERINSLSDNHKYNLYNSTWYQEKADLNAASARKNVATAFFDTLATYPSNADVSSVGIVDDGSGNIVFDANLVFDAEFGSSVAPRGHYVYNIFNIDRTVRLTAPEVSGVPSTTVNILSTISLAGTPTFNPDNPTDGQPSGGGGEDPYLPPTDTGSGDFETP